MHRVAEGVVRQIAPELARVGDLDLGEVVDAPPIDQLLPGDGKNRVVLVPAHDGARQPLGIGVPKKFLAVHQLRGGLHRGDRVRAVIGGAESVGVRLRRDDRVLAEHIDLGDVDRDLLQVRERVSDQVVHVQLKGRHRVRVVLVSALAAPAVRPDPGQPGQDHREEAHADDGREDHQDAFCPTLFHVSPSLHRTAPLVSALSSWLSAAISHSPSA